MEGATLARAVSIGRDGQPLETRTQRQAESLYEIIERMYPDPKTGPRMPRIELSARNRRKG